ncbi:MAG: RNA polymerase sigma factor, partial [Actinobacteria bacterium]|nr:RNA polymerase sigma factor [Actinomycetota bacterium]
RHERRVYNLAFRMLGREEDARDATQDAFLSALRKLQTFRGQAAFTTWMHRVTVNACYDILRRRGREPVVSIDRTDDDRPPGPEPSSPDHGDAAAAAVDVQRALLLVPQDFRAVLILHDAQDLGYERIGEILGVPVGTVKSRLHRGRIALGRILRGEPPGPGPSSDPTTEPTSDPRTEPTSEPRTEPRAGP